MTDRVRFLSAPIGDDDIQSDFTCGVHALDDFYRRHALKNHRSGLGKTTVFRRATDDTRLPSILGFYTLSMATVESALLPASGTRLPKYPLPVALIGRLAVDTRAQGHGLGSALLVDALIKVAQLASEIGCFGVIVDAKAEPAMSFYERHGFQAITESWPMRMFLPLSSVQSLMQETAGG